VIGVSKAIGNVAAGDLNVDPESGKSINAIRPFRGRGIVVWGARTLAGQDLEWRYVPVRRLITQIEKDLRRIVSEMVFERNDAITWYRIHGQAEDYLRRWWERGALNGATPEEAFYVRLGQGVTMTEEDVREGRLIVEIGLAAVRPAEFIILKYEQML
jgi:phage tail sheath protein FI